MIYVILGAMKLNLAIESYLKENIDSHIRIEKWSDVSKIPLFLRNIYQIYTMKILGTQCILLEIIGEAPGIENIQKHLNRIEKITNQQIVFYYKVISRYRRKSLIKNKISFIVADGQMFLPFLGLNLKKTTDYFEKERKIFTPSAQAAFLYFLYNKMNLVNTTEISKILGWNQMTASRALNELYKARLLNFEIGGKTGRSKVYRRITDPDYFKKGNELLRSPIKKTFFVKMQPKNSFVAGLEALAELSMINSPEFKVRAIYHKYFDSRDLEIIRNDDIVKDKKIVELQVWEYNPQLFTKIDIVDKASLYASLKEENDERIEQALDEVLQGEEWYTD